MKYEYLISVVYPAQKDGQWTSAYHSGVYRIDGGKTPLDSTNYQALSQEIANDINGALDTELEWFGFAIMNIHLFESNPTQNKNIAITGMNTNSRGERVVKFIVEDLVLPKGELPDNVT